MAEKARAEVIMQYIKEHNLTKKEFCKLCNIGKSTLYRVLKGENGYDPLFKIAFATKIPMKDLLIIELVERNNGLLS